MCDNGNGENGEKLTKRQELFIEWLATTKYERYPLTQEQLAEELGCHRNTLTRWKRKPGFMDLVTAKARSMVHDKLPEVYAALTREAEKGSFQHIKLILEMAGEHENTQNVDLTTKGESLNDGRGTDEQRATAMVSLLDAFRAGLLRPDSQGAGAVVAPERPTNGSDILSG